MSATFSQTSLKLIATGASLPGAPVDNDTLFEHLRVHSSERNVKVAKRIAAKLGINSRHVSRDLSLARSGTRAGLHSRDLCSNAIRAACDEADLDTAELDYLIGHTTTPYSLLPANIAWVAQDLQFQSPYMELRQACTGFASALHIASGMIGAGTCERISIVGSETGSAYFAIEDEFLDREQLVNFVQMGDGAGAVILGADDKSERHIISNIFAGHIGHKLAPGFSLHGGGSENPLCDFGIPRFTHDSKSVLANGPGLFHAGVNAIESRGYQLDEFDLIIPHQANGHLAQAFGEAFKLDPQRVYVTADKLGNLGSAAIWVTLDQLIRSRRLMPGDKVLVLGAEASKYLYGGFVYHH